MRLVVPSFVALLGALAATTADAALVVTIGDGTLTPGGTGSIDVTISSDNLLSGDPLALAGFEFLITPVTGTSQLSFVSPQSDSQLDNKSYVFYNNSSDYISMTNVGSVSGGQDQTFIGSDGTNDGTNVTVTGVKLLAVLDLTHSFGAADPITTIGDSFMVSLVDDTSNTFFYDANGTLLDYTSTPGTVTVVPGPLAAVPEPGTFGMLLVGMTGLAWFRRWRGRSCASRPAK